MVLLLVPVGDPLGVDDVVRGEDLGVLLVLELVRLGATREFEDALCVGDPLLSRRLGQGALGAVVDADQLGGLVEERNVRGVQSAGPVTSRRITFASSPAS